MIFKIFIFSCLLVNLVKSQGRNNSADSCVNNYACVAQAGNLIRSFNTGVKSATSCREICQKNKECQHFTWYDSNGAFPQNCFLYSYCHLKDDSCDHCHSGPRHCRPSHPPCSPIGGDYGGTWFCFPKVTSMDSPVPHGTRCIFKCPAHMAFHTCQEGKWSDKPGEIQRCMCPSIQQAMGGKASSDGDMVCWPPQTDFRKPVPAGTYCLHTCHGHPKHEMRCRHASWTMKPEELSCERRSAKKSLMDFVQEQENKISEEDDLDIENVLVNGISSLIQKETEDDEENLETIMNGETLQMVKVNKTVQSEKLIQESNNHDTKPVLTYHYKLISDSDNIETSIPSSTTPPEYYHSTPQEEPHKYSQNNLYYDPTIHKTAAHFLKELPKQPTAQSLMSFNEFLAQKYPQYYRPHHAPQSNSLYNNHHLHHESNYVPHLYQSQHPHYPESAPSPYPPRHSPTPPTYLPTSPHPPVTPLSHNAGPLPEKLPNALPTLHYQDLKNGTFGQLKHDDKIFHSETKSLPATHQKKKSISHSFQSLKLPDVNYTHNFTTPSIGDIPNLRFPINDISEIVTPSLDKSSISSNRPFVFPTVQSHQAGYVELRNNKSNNQKKNPFIPSSKKNTPANQFWSNVQSLATADSAETNEELITESSSENLNYSPPNLNLESLSPPSPHKLMSSTPFPNFPVNKLTNVALTTTVPPQRVVIPPSSSSGNNPPVQQQEHIDLIYDELRGNNGWEPSKRKVIGTTKLHHNNNYLDQVYAQSIEEEVDEHLANNEKSYICVKPGEIQNGKLHCDDERRNIDGTYPVHSRCRLRCQPGFSPVGSEWSICKSNGVWVSTNPLKCVKSMAILIGGWNPIHGLLSNVEVVNPSNPRCSDISVASLPSPRKGLVAEWVDGSIIACGGVNETSTENLCWRFDVSKNTWIPFSGLKTERHFASSAVLQSDMYVIGGRDGGAEPMALGSVERLDRYHKWKHAMDVKLPIERAYHCVAPAGDDSLIITGGYSWNSVMDKASIFNLSQPASGWLPLGHEGKIETARYLHACGQVPMEGSDSEPLLLIAGGYSEGYLSSTEIYDHLTGRWHRTGSLSVPRQGGQMVVIEGKPTIFGGFYSVDKYPDSIEQYDVRNGRWDTISSRLKIPRRYFALVEVPETLFSPHC